MKETTKTIRNKMYSWVRGKGIVLGDKEHKEIKKIMEEYRNLEIPTPLINAKEEAKQSGKKTIERKAEWKPYPVD